jgi:hypothetical protein
VTLEIEDLDEIKKSALETFSERVASVDFGISGEVDLEVARLESQLLQLYAIAAIIARREESLERTAQVWDAMVSICDAFAAKISELCQEHPACRASHDKILDVRNKCARLRDLHS